MADYDVQTETALLLDDSVRGFGKVMEELGDLQHSGLIAFEGEAGVDFWNTRRGRWIQTYQNLRDRYDKLVKTLQELNKEALDATG